MQFKLKFNLQLENNLNSPDSFVGMINFVCELVKLNGVRSGLSSLLGHRADESQYYIYVCIFLYNYLYVNFRTLPVVVFFFCIDKITGYKVSFDVYDAFSSEKSICRLLYTVEAVRGSVNCEIS